MSKRSSSLLIDEQPLQVIPTLAAKLGVNQAILLQQINYWIKHSEKAKDERKYKRGKWWTYNTYSDWQEQMPWLSESGIRKLVKQLKDRNLIAVVKHNKQGQDHTLWYTINYEAVQALSDESDVSESDTSKCPDGAADVSESDTSYATESRTESSEEESFQSSSSGGDAASADAAPEQSNGKPEKPISYRAYCHKRARELVKEAKQQSYSPDTLPDKTVNEWSAFYESAITRDGYSKEQCDAALWWLIRKASGAIEGEPQGWAAFGTGLRAALSEQDEAPNAQTELEKKRLEKENAEIDEMAREAARLMQRETQHG